MTALFISPHPDDLALSCGGWIARLADRGERPAAITVFSDGAAPDQPRSYAVRQIENKRWRLGPDAWTVRRQEDARGLAVLGATGTWLGYRDAIYRHDDYAGSAAHLFGPIKDSDAALAREIADVVVAAWQRSGAAVVYLPLAAGNHVDHQICRDLHAPLAAAGAAVQFYEDFPYALGEDVLADARAKLGPLEPCFGDVSATIDRRIEAIAAYASQIPALFRASGPWPGPFDRLVRDHAAREGGVFEVFWRPHSPAMPNRSLSASLR